MAYLTSFCPLPKYLYLLPPGYHAITSAILGSSPSSFPASPEKGMFSGGPGPWSGWLWSCRSARIGTSGSEDMQLRNWRHGLRLVPAHRGSGPWVLPRYSDIASQLPLPLRCVTSKRKMDSKPSHCSKAAHFLSFFAQMLRLGHCFKTEETCYVAPGTGWIVPAQMELCLWLRWGWLLLQSL